MTAPFKVLRLLPAIALVATFLAAIDFVRPAGAQRIQRIAAIVNDDIVSMYDLQSRLRLVVATTRIKVTPQMQARLTQQVLRVLIDETLQLQEAKKEVKWRPIRNLKMFPYYIKGGWGEF